MLGVSRFTNPSVLRINTNEWWHFLLSYALIFIIHWQRTSKRTLSHSFPVNREKEVAFKRTRAFPKAIEAPFPGQRGLLRLSFGVIPSPHHMPLFRMYYKVFCETFLCGENFLSVTSKNKRQLLGLGVNPIKWPKSIFVLGLQNRI